MTEMNDPVEIRRRIEAMAARIDRRDDYGQLLARSEVIRRREDVPSPEDWRTTIRGQARGDRLRVRTGVSKHIVYAYLVDGNTAARREESDRFLEVLRRAVPAAFTLGHEPAVLARDGDEAVLRCERCPALSYADAVDDVLGGAMVEDRCPHDEPPRETPLTFMYVPRPSGS